MPLLAGLRCLLFSVPRAGPYCPVTLPQPWATPALGSGCELNAFPGRLIAVWFWENRTPPEGCPRPLRRKADETVREPINCMGAASVQPP